MILYLYTIFPYHIFMSNLITTTYVSLYTVPWTLKSMSIFEKYGVYFWWDFTASTFHIEDIKNTEYIGIGKEVHSNEYMNVSYAWKIATDKNFEPIYFHFKTRKTNISCTILEEWFSKIESDNFKKYQIAEAFQVQVEAFEKENWELKSSTADSWYCIVTDKSSMFETSDESTFYRSKHITPFGINIEGHTGKYTPNKNLLNQLHLFADCYLDIWKNILWNKRTGKKVNLWGMYGVAMKNILIEIANWWEWEFTSKWSNDPLLDNKKVDDFIAIFRRKMRSVDMGYNISLVTNINNYKFSVTIDERVK